MINRNLPVNVFINILIPNDIDEAARCAWNYLLIFYSKPTFMQISREFMDFISGAELLIHNAPFDTGFINYELQLTKQSWKPIQNIV